MIGQTISHYEITEKLGEGGMGVVYKATDTSLDRTVALKFLARHLLEDDQHKARFVQEAKAAAALDHPNICTIYEIGEAEGQAFMAMAFLDGSTVSEKIKERPLKLDEALDIALQAGEGLRAAHEKGIVHRDVKSSNLMLTKDGRVQIMDFGLAYLSARTRLTKSETVLGTPAYMSPEQALGQAVDRRTDIWSLGVVIYEMVTGRLPFEGEREQAVLYAIANEDPEPPTALRSRIPIELDRIVFKTMAKGADERYPHIDDMLVDLRALRKELPSTRATPVGARQGVPAAAAGKAPSPVPPSAEREAPVRLTRRLWRERIVLGAALLVLAVVILVWSLRSPETPGPTRPMRFAFTPGTDVWDPVISPNGRHIAYIAGKDVTKLWVQDLDQQRPRELTGTEGATHGAAGACGLFWSPDSASIGFTVGTELKKISARGGQATLLCRLPGYPYWGGAWSPDGNTIVFTAGVSPELYKVSSGGGSLEFAIEMEEIEQYPREQGMWFLTTPHYPAVETGKRLLMFSRQIPGNSRMVLRNLDTGEQETLGAGFAGVYSPSGHVLAVYTTSGVSGGLWALPVSTSTLKPMGEPFLVAEHAWSPSIGPNGTLVYLDRTGSGWRLVWRDRTGKKVGVAGQSQDMMTGPELSPDGRRMVVAAVENNFRDIWIHDVERSVKTRFTFDKRWDAAASWSPSGEQITFYSGAEDHLHAGSYTVSKPVGGTGEGTRLPHEIRFPLDWSRDERYLLGTSSPTGDIWYAERKDNNTYEAAPFLQERFRQRAAKFSPDGRLVAYSSNESGRYEVYVRRFPDGGGKRQMSQNGGGQPRWSNDGKEMFYVEDDWLAVIPVTMTPSFSVGSPRRLFQSAGFRGEYRGTDAVRRSYDVSADGKRFVIAEPLEDAPPPVIRVVQNWAAEFQGNR